MDVVYLSPKGMEKLKQELHDLKYVKRPEVSQKVATARDHGDLKENAEYHAAREELSFVETKILQLQLRLSQARVIDSAELSTDQVTIFSKVTVLDVKRKKEIVYTIVSAEEADLKCLKISVASPIGKGLLGKKIGERAEIQVPAGIITYDILNIDHDI